MDISHRLETIKDDINFGIIGTGFTGKAILYQSEITPKINCVVISDKKIERAISCAKSLGKDYLVVGNLADMHNAIKSGKLAICIDSILTTQCELIDVFVDVTFDVADGLKYAKSAIENHKHIVMYNSEADSIFGPYLSGLAEKEGVVYTSGDGDQHTALKRLINEIEFWGFKNVMAGNMKGYLDRYSNPTSIIPEAEKRNLDYKMCASYTDGTKLNIEMALIANSIGGITITPGMKGPRLKDIYDIFSIFDFEKIWDGSTPVVDYVLGAYPAGGVYVIGFNNQPYQMEKLAYYPSPLGDGPFYVFHRPYHLGHFEVMKTIAEVFLDKWAILKPSFGLKTNVYAYAKKPLYRGEILDGIGGYATYGLIENCSDNLTEPGLPICLAENVSMKKDVQKDEKIYLKDIVYDERETRFEIFFIEQNHLKTH
ncbi:MAG: homoserine dehydrogenase [Candidatus Lokiarchaeota archaeon]|nr:homoserine dehydrogenase [Candidatus Lokiarchaeota archaeon]